jgi:hypothetical protein
VLALRSVAVLYPAYFRGTQSHMALMDFAEKVLISRLDSRSGRLSRFSLSRLDPSCHHVFVTRATLLTPPLGLVDYTAAAGTGTRPQPSSKSRLWANKAQIVRAILFASATIATFVGRRCASCRIHSGGDLL